MAGLTEIKTFSGGMNKDLDFSLVKENQYYDARNFKLVANSDSTGFTLENAEGNKLWLDISGVSGLSDEYYLVGSCYIQPYLVLWYTTNHIRLSPSTGTSIIVRCTVDKDELQQAVIIYNDSAKLSKLNLSDSYPISAVGYYEGDDNIKVYFTDNYNNVRWMNIMDDTTASYDPDMFEFTPNFPISVSTNVRAQFDSLIEGNIPNGAIQYSYQYYIENGAATVYSPASAIIQIPKTDSAYSNKVAGGSVEDLSQYGVMMNIEIPNTNKFNKIRVIAIQYTSYLGVPTVRIFSEQDITPDTEYTIKAIDVGETLGELTYDEYLIQNSNSFKAKTLVIKDNYLFAGNIREEFFDVDIDMRAYRFNSSNDAYLFEGDLSSYYRITTNTGTWVSHGLEGASGTDWSIPEGADCINLYNRSNYNSSNDEKDVVCIYQWNGTTRGAQGPNIKIYLDDDIIEEDVIEKNVQTWTDAQWASDGTMYIPGKKSFQRNEVYRIGAILRNTKLQATPVKWILDLKMPAFHEDSGTKWNLSEDDAVEVIRKRLGIKAEFIGDWSSTGAASWELVCVPRESKDRSILAQGLLGKTYYHSSYEYFWPTFGLEDEVFTYTSGDIDQSELLMKLISPEVAFNKNIEFKEDDFIQYNGYMTGIFKTTPDPDARTLDVIDSALFPGMEVNRVHHHTGAGDFTSKDRLDDAKIMGYTTDPAYRSSIHTYSYAPYCLSDGTTTTDIGANTTALLCAFEAGYAGDTDTADRFAFVNYKRDIFLTQYGGLTYEARQQNSYISISDLNIDNDSTYIKTWEGDTFIDWFIYNNVCNNLDESAATTEACVIMFPVESSISISHRLDDGYHRQLGLHGRLVQEIAGEWASNIIDGAVERNYIQELPLYTYEPIYSTLNRATVYIADSPSFDDSLVYSVRIKRSEVKTNNETLDSFTRFLPNNFKDLNGQYGPINNLLIFNNQIFFWQNSGFGVASVNTRSIIQDNNPGILALGTGGVLDRYDYISDTIGNQSQFGIAKSGNALYWGDINKNELFKFDNKLTPLSKTKFIQTWITDNGRMGDLKVVYDHKYNDVLFTITFARVFTCETTLNGKALAFSAEPSTGLTSASSYNIIGNARFPSTVQNGYRNTISAFGQDWIIGNAPYGVANTEYYFTVDHDSIQTHTLIYNEQGDAFSGFSDATPAKYIELDTNYLSTNTYHDIYKHNDVSAQKSTYYGTAYDSTISFVFNKEYPHTKVWDSLKWDSTSKDEDGINQFEDTFEEMTIYNDYQTTGNRTLYIPYLDEAVPATRPTPIARRDRTWSLAIPRNIMDQDVSSNADITNTSNWDDTQTFKERMRSKWLMCNFTKENTYNNSYSVSFVAVLYRNSVR